MKQKKIFALLLMLYCCSSFNTSETAWELQKSEKGINVYTRIAKNSGLKEVRVVNNVKSSLAAIVALSFDSDNYTNWIYKCSEAKTLKKVSDQEEYQYQVTSVPWPFNNRDVVTDAKVSQDANTKVVTIVATGEPSYIPAKSGIERVQHYKSQYTLTPLSNDSIHIEFELFVDPGGNVPDWLINANIVLGPYSTTVEMLNQLPKYQSTFLGFIKEK